VATISCLLKSISLFCKRALLKRLYSAKENYHFKEPTNRSHPIHDFDELVCAYIERNFKCVHTLNVCLIVRIL